MAKRSKSNVDRSVSREGVKLQHTHSNESINLKDSETRCETFCRIFKICVKRFIAFLFSHVGLTCVVVGYTILGGIIFKEIELPEEKQTRLTVGETKDLYAEKITTFFFNSDREKILEKQTWDKEMGRLLREYEVEVYKHTKEKDWDGQFEGEAYQWSFAESLLYSVTVITTIGK